MNLENFQILHLYPHLSGLASHAHSLDNFGRIRRRSDRSGSSLSVVLTVRHITYTTKSMAFHDTLETLSFGSSDYIDDVSFAEHFVHHEFIAQAFLYAKIPEFSHVLLRGS